MIKKEEKINKLQIPPLLIAGPGTELSALTGRGLPTACGGLCTWGNQQPNVVAEA